jgi:pseudo-rSAM protein
MKSNNWIYIEPFVHISLTEDKALLYNTLNGKALEYKKNEKSYDLIKQLNDDKNLLVLGITKSDFTESEIKKFIRQIKNNFMGDVINSLSETQKPIQIKPIFNIQKDIKTMKESEEGSIGTRIMQNITDVTININNSCNLNCKNCIDAFKQFYSCSKYKRSNTELNIRSVKKILDNLSGSSLKIIHINGGNILIYSKFEELIDLLDTHGIIAKLHIHYRNILDNNKISYLTNKNVVFEILVDTPIDINVLECVKMLLGNKNIKACYTFVIKNELDYIEVENSFMKLRIENFLIQPYYDGFNLSFFKRNVFINKKDIFDSKPSMGEIYARQVINSIYFGKLIIMCNGNIYANLNGKIIRNIELNSLFEVAQKEMNEGESWRKTRADVKPCKYCLYRFLCPPISNYEYSIGRFNLCKNRLKNSTFSLG